MKAWKDEMANLTVDVARGWMSAYELEGLESGAVIRSSSEAGWSQRVCLNGEFFANGSIVIVGKRDGHLEEARFCVRLDGLEDDEEGPLQPERGDSVLELLPFSIRMASLGFRMGDLEGLGPRSFINLNRTFSAGEDAELWVAGRKIGTGKVLVIGENFGIRLRTLETRAEKKSPPRTTGAVLSPAYSAEQVKDYDFRRPDGFSKRVILRMAEIHMELLRGLASRFPEFSGFRLGMVDQMVYGEWLDDPKGALASVVACRPAERKRDYAKERPARFPARFWAQTADTPCPLDDSWMAYAREWTEKELEGGSGLPVVIGFDAASAEILGRDPGFEVGLACLRNGWMQVVDLRLGRAAGGETEVVTAPPLRDEGERWHMILLVRLEGPEGRRIDIVYPQEILEPHLLALGRR